MENNICVTFEDGKQIKANYKDRMGDLLEIVEKDLKDILALKINNEITTYDYQVVNNCSCEFVKYNSQDGERIYGRSLEFILYMALVRLYPEATMEFNNKMDRDFYLTFNNLELTEEVVSNLKKEMNRIIEMDLKIEKRNISYDEAKILYTKINDIDKLENLQSKMRSNFTIYFCDGIYNYLHGVMVPSTGYIKGFDLRKHREGALLILPEKDNINEVKENVIDNKLYDVFKEYSEYNKRMGIDNVGQLNEMVIDGKINNIIRFSEAIHDRKLIEVAQRIEAKKMTKIILIAGPSSSGKTTFAQKLGVQLKISGLNPITVSMDNYFKEREDNPVDENGKYNFECVEALDIKLFNSQMMDLIDGKEVVMPTFDFKLGTKTYTRDAMKLEEKDVLIVEGIHALNDILSEFIPENKKFKVYLAPITTLSLDNYTKVSSTDVRLIRRIVRDIVSRGYSVEKTLEMWENVTKGEKDYIYPFVNNADYIYNTSLLYEQGVIKTFIQPLLLQVDNTSKYYSEARRLYEFMNAFLPIETSEIPIDSIIREFIGNGCFYR